MSTTQEVVVDTPVTLADRFSSLLTLVDEQTKTHSSFMKTVNSELKALQKELSKAQTKPRKKKKEPVDGEDVVKRKNVFEVPVPVSDELCDFLGVTRGEMCSRQFVTNSITKYVKDNELQNPENKRYILLDTTDAGRKLNDLLAPDQPLTFFNMQRYLKPHYPRVDNKTEKGEATDRTDTSVESSESVEEKPKKKTRTKKDPEPTGVVADADVVDDTPAEEPEGKKKVRRAVRKA